MEPQIYSMALIFIMATLIVFKVGQFMQEVFTYKPLGAKVFTVIEILIFTLILLLIKI
jgi:F0F1-type ATP synthase assembly protein I